MMKLYLIYRVIIVALFIVCSVASVSHAQFTVFEDQPLSFGRFTFASIGPNISIRLNSNGSYTSNGNVVELDPPVVGLYTLTGTPGVSFNASGGPDITLNGPGPGTFRMYSISVSPGNTSFDGSGNRQLSVGARLEKTVSGTFFQNGDYTGNYNIFISF